MKENSLVTVRVTRLLLRRGGASSKEPQLIGVATMDSLPSVLIPAIPDERGATIVSPCQLCAPCTARGTIPERDIMGFRDAARLYVQSGGEDRYLRPLIAYFGETPLSEIDQEAVDAAAAALKPLARPSTRCRQVHAVVSAIVKHCAAVGLCRWRRFRRPRSEHIRRMLTRDEAVRLVAACSRQIRPSVLLVFEGLRPGEALRLDWSQIDLEVPLVRLRRNGRVVVLRLHERTLMALTKLSHRQGAVLRTLSAREYAYKRPSIKTAFKGACFRAGLRNITLRDCSFAGYLFDKGGWHAA
jgi:integrase